MRVEGRYVPTGTPGRRRPLRLGHLAPQLGPDLPGLVEGLQPIGVSDVRHHRSLAVPGRGAVTTQLPDRARRGASAEQSSGVCLPLRLAPDKPAAREVAANTTPEVGLSVAVVMSW